MVDEADEVTRSDAGRKSSPRMPRCGPRSPPWGRDPHTSRRPLPRAGASLRRLVRRTAWLTRRSELTTAGTPNQEVKRKVHDATLTGSERELRDMIDHPANHVGCGRRACRRYFWVAA